MTDRDRFLEALEVVILALTERRLTYHGSFYDYEDVPITFQPVQRPYPPLWFGIGRPEAAVWAADNDVNAVALLPAPLVRPIADRYREALAVSSTFLAAIAGGDRPEQHASVQVGLAHVHAALGRDMPLQPCHPGRLCTRRIHLQHNLLWSRSNFLLRATAVTTSCCVHF